MPGTSPKPASPPRSSEFRDLGLDTVTIAGSYHAGKFLRPHGKAGKVYFPEDGTVYFNADPSRYGAIKPVANGLLGERDVLRELVDDGSMAVNVWLVLLHNTRLGMAHPDAVVAQRLRRPLLSTTSARRRRTRAPMPSASPRT